MNDLGLPKMPEMPKFTMPGFSSDPGKSSQESGFDNPMAAEVTRLESFKKL